MATLTRYERVTRSRQVQANLIFRISPAGYGDVYICDNRSPFKAMLATTPVNPILRGIEGLDVGDFSRIGDIRLAVENRKLNRQLGGLTDTVKFSDITKEHLEGALVVGKQVAETTGWVSISSFDDSRLRIIFWGRVKAPLEYDDKTFTITATSQEMTSENRIPERYIGEDDGIDPANEHRVVPIVFGDCSVKNWGGYLDPNLNLQEVRAIYRQHSVRAHVLDHARRLIALSDKPVQLGPWERLAIKMGDILPSDFVVADSSVAFSTQPNGIRVAQVDPDGDNLLWAYTLVRCDGEHYLTGGPCDGIYNLSPGFDPEAYKSGEPTTVPAGLKLGVSTPVVENITGIGEHAMLYDCLLFIHMKMCEGATFELRVWFWGDRKEVIVDSQNRPCRNSTPSQWIVTFGTGDIWGNNEGLFIHSNQSRHYLPSASDNDRPKFRDEWSIFTKSKFLSIYLHRTDSGPGDCILYGIYAIPVANIHHEALPTADANPAGIRFGYQGKGWPTGGVGITDKAHPRDIIYSILTNLMGVDSSFIDFKLPSEVPEIKGWQLGWSQQDSIELERLLEAIQEQSSTMLVRDTEGTYRLYVMARYGGRPTWMRYGHSLAVGRDIFNLKVRNLGEQWVRNRIIIDYHPNEDGQFTRAAWVKAGDSDDGYGMRSPVVEEICSQSKSDYGERTLQLGCNLIRHRGTAVGLRDFLVGRYSATKATGGPPSAILFDSTLLGDVLQPGMILTVDPTTADRYAKFNGETWYSRFFQIEHKARRGDGYSFTALQCPTIQVVEAGMVPRYKLRGARP